MALGSRVLPCTLQSLVSTCSHGLNRSHSLAQTLTVILSSAHSDSSSHALIAMIAVLLQIKHISNSMGAQEFGGRQGESLEPIKDSHMPLDTLKVSKRRCEARAVGTGTPFVDLSLSIRRVTIEAVAIIRHSDTNWVCFAHRIASTDVQSS